jgi:hypothetical protein
MEEFAVVDDDKSTARCAGSRPEYGTMMMVERLPRLFVAIIAHSSAAPVERSNSTAVGGCASIASFG